ncbi:elongator complex protein 4 [[Candida] anglica]|uniref:Elongator complex protein 4 n=1 Tax=[Candida] anglica TaxID=148631 RepID=A0ABP0EFE7_9ASCO
MSFRKRSDIIGTPGAPGISRGAPLPGRGIPGGIPGAVPGRSSIIMGGGRILSGSRPPANTAKEDEITKILQHPGVKPSLITSRPTVSTGSSDLDKILLHSGLPLGTSLLVEESGTTDFASILLRVFASQGVMHNRLNDKRNINTHVIVVGFQQEWAKELPGLYKGSSKEQKKAKIAANESKLSISNLSNSTAGTTARSDKDLKIAWRYGLNKKPEDADDTEVSSGGAKDDYNHQFDITQRLVPTPASQEVTFVPVNDQSDRIIKQIESILVNQLKSDSSKVIRLVIPNFLNPSIYPPTFSSPQVMMPFMHSLRSLLRKYSNNLVAISSISLDLYPKDTNSTFNLETLADSVIQLQPFNQEMSQLIEKAYKNEPAKIQHGLVHIVKVPILSERGLMMVHDGEYAFRNGKKKFEIEPWGIPVDDDSKDEEKQTTKNIEF